MKASKLLRPLGVVFAALGVLVLTTFAFMHWRLDTPSSAERRFQQALAARPMVAAADNAEAYIWAFDTAEADPAAAGARRLVWIAGFNAGERSKPDPHQRTLDVKNSHAPQLEKVLAACKSDPIADCRREFDALAARPAWSATDATMLARYDRLLRYRTFHATVAQELRTPIPAWSAVLDAQRLYFIRMVEAARAADVAIIREQLGADLVFWRTTQESSDILITKMIAIAGIRQHYFFSNLLLRRLPAARVRDALPEIWQQPTSTHELSMWRVLAGEYEFSKSVTRENAIDLDGPLYPEDESFGDRALRKIGRGLYPPQMMLRHVAQAYAETAVAFEVPLDRYLAVAKALNEKKLKRGLSRPTSYCVRTASIEIWRRAALLMAGMRAAAVPASGMRARIDASPLRDPLTGKAFEWNESLQALVVTAGRGSDSGQMPLFR